MNDNCQYEWLETGDGYYAALVSAISSAARSIRLETYIFAEGSPGDEIRSALAAAAKRGVAVRVLIDGFGSMDLPDDYWNSLKAAGGELRIFNPLDPGRIMFRDHRKMLACDSSVAFIGGFNITGEEAGDGIKSGWRDLALCIRGGKVSELEETFDRMFDMAGFRHRRLHRLGSSLFCRWKKPAAWPSFCLLAGSPGGWNSPIKRTLQANMKNARNIRIISAYFLPSWQMIRSLRKVARHGGSVQIITSGKTDVMMARYAGRSLYDRLLHAGVKIFEYDAQVLHTKLIVVDNAVYAGSANMDNRSLNINYELLVRIDDPGLVSQACRIFDGYLPLCRAIEHDEWEKARGPWEKIVERLARFILANVDTYLSRRKLSKLR